MYIRYFLIAVLVEHLSRITQVLISLLDTDIDGT